MVVYFTTVVRTAPPDRGGELVKLDWEAKRVIARVPMAAQDPPLQDPNPRGSTRGGRGVLLNGNEIYAASYHTIHVFDRRLATKGKLIHPLFANLHELSWDGDAIWASSTDLDGAIKVDRAGRTIAEWWPREDPVTSVRFKLRPLDFDKSQDNRARFVGNGKPAAGHVHLNAVATQDGRPLMLLNRFGCVVRLEPTEILVDDPTLKGCHNLLVLADGRLAVNDTVNRAVRLYDRDGRPLGAVDLHRFAPVQRIIRRHIPRDIGIWLAKHGRPSRVFNAAFAHLAVARPIFVRGLAQTPRGTVLVGI
ncbi:MAG TPA: hypothetical protein VGX76_02490 [Pirellulales bacterium]|nr:hypothetical protein [Pirellulales bacterium]